MFQKLVAIEPVSLIPTAEEALHQYAREVELYRDIPADDEEIVRRIGDADAALLSYTSRMGRDVIARCPDLRYIGMCCSLYSEESANVDIAFAREKGIKVLGIRDYGDRGVVEYVLHELTGLLHGFGMPMLRDEPVEILGLRVGVVGLGVSGRMIADALAFLGADISYYSRSHKPDAEAAGMNAPPPKIQGLCQASQGGGKRLCPLLYRPVPLHLLLGAKGAGGCKGTWDPVQSRSNHRKRDGPECACTCHNIRVVPGWEVCDPEHSVGQEIFEISGRIIESSKTPDAQTQCSP